MSPLALSDDELRAVMTLADAVPVENRDSFLRALADAIAGYPADSRGPGALHRAAAQLQRDFLFVAPMFRSKYS
jgi:hypothetical protein